MPTSGDGRAVTPWGMKAEIIPDEIRYTARKTLAIKIDKFGRLVVCAPKGYAKEKIDAFIAEKAAWIRKHQGRFAATAIPLAPENLEGYVFPLLGRQVTLCLAERKTVGYDTENGVVYLPRQNAREKLIAWLKENAKRIFTEQTAKHAERMGLRHTSVAVNGARHRWGSCSANGSIRYTFRLLYCPKEIIEYVIVHELCHLVHLDHSPAFWQTVEGYLPDWKPRRQWLKDRGILLELF